VTDDHAHDTITVRAPRSEDLPAASKLAAALVRQHHVYDPLRFMSIEPFEEGYERFLQTQVDRDGVVLLVAARRRGGVGAVVGYLLGSLEDRDWSDLRDACGKIHDVYVDESVRMRGGGVASGRRGRGAFRGDRRSAHGPDGCVAQRGRPASLRAPRVPTDDARDDPRDEASRLTRRPLGLMRRVVSEIQASRLRGGKKP